MNFPGRTGSKIKLTAEFSRKTNQTVEAFPAAAASAAAVAVVTLKFRNGTGSAEYVQFPIASAKFNR